MDLEWDEVKAETNWRKHAVTFEEAASALDDPLSLTFEDHWHSQHEDRYLTIGSSRLGRVLIVAHTERDGRIRIISARLASPGERRNYEDGF